MAPIVRGRKGEFKDLLDKLDQQGFRARVDGEMRDLSEPIALDKRKNHTIEAVVDRILLKPGAEKLAKRLGSLRRQVACRWPTVWSSSASPATPTGQSPFQAKQLFSSSMACPDCGLDVPKLEPRSFSFNCTFGACPECHGLGRIYDFDPAKVITDWSKPLLDGGLGPGSASQYLLKLIHLAAAALQDRPEEALRGSARKAAAHPGLRTAQGRSAAHRLPRHSRLPARLDSRSKPAATAIAST